MSVVFTNKLKYITRGALYNTASLCLSGTLMQTFLGEIGLSDLIFIHATLLQAANVLTTVLLSRFADGQGHLGRKMALLQLPIALFYLLYIPLCIAPMPSLGAFLLSAAVGVIQSFFVALCNVCDYKLPYHIIPVYEYGTMSAINGIVSALCAIAVGEVFSFLCTLFPYTQLMCFALPAAAVMTLIGALLSASMRRAAEAVGQISESHEKLPLRALFRADVFWQLALPNLARGISTGVISVLAATALSLGYQAATVTRMVSIQSIAMLIACFLFALLSRRVQPRYMILVGSVMTAVLPLLLIQSEWAFLALFGVVTCGRFLVDYGVPATLYRVVPDRIAGPYHAWRLILHSGGSVLATSVAVFLPPTVLLFLAAALQLFSGICYGVCRVLRSR